MALSGVISFTATRWRARKINKDGALERRKQLTPTWNWVILEEYRDNMRNMPVIWLD